MGGILVFYRPAIAYSLALFLAVASIVTVDRATRPPEPPSVVLITVDSLRADHLGTYGYARETSPNIDALARRGVVFDRAFTVETLSGPSHASMFTSLFPVTHGVVYNGHELRDEAWTLAELLRSADYRTAAVVGDRLVGAGFGYDQGFDRFQLMPVSLGVHVRKTVSGESRAYRLALNWLRELRGERFFLWLHCQNPHFDYDPPPPYDSKFLAGIPGDYPYRQFETLRRAVRHAELDSEDEARVTALYDGEVAFTDAMLKPIFDELRDQHGDILILLTADHGDLLFEPRAVKRVGHGGGHFYDDAMRVPLIVVPPGGPVGRADALVSAVDLLPTVADYAGIEPPDGIEGLSLRPLIAGESDEARDAVHAMYLRHEHRSTLAVRTERYKLIHRGGSPPRDELYDLREDPAELHDLAAERPEIVRSLRDDLLGWFDARPDGLKNGRRRLSPEVEELLRRGGYLEDDDD